MQLIQLSVSPLLLILNLLDFNSLAPVPAVDIYLNGICLEKLSAAPPMLLTRTIYELCNFVDQNLDRYGRRAFQKVFLSKLEQPQ